ncbi:MAG: sugar transferase [Chloroflexota bacterium]
MKRLMDIVIAAAALVLLAPVLALVAIAILISMGRPILFRQMRPGHLGHPFELVKFRSMHMERDLPGPTVPEHHRLTRLGYFLRRASLDELPELWNIVKGDMSLVGPRPLLMQYLPLYTAEQARRHDVKPGLTGLAQVRGRQLLDWEERFKLDVWYVDNLTIGLDLQILASTVIQVIGGRGFRPKGALDSDFTGLTGDEP